MAAHGVQRQPQEVGHLAVGDPLGEEAHQLAFTGRETDRRIGQVGAGRAKALGQRARSRWAARSDCCGTDYKVTITKPGYQPETVQITSGMTWWFLLPMFTITGPFELISVFNGAVYAYDEDGIEVTLFREGRKPQGAVAYDP